jgi:hypothetical protein
VESAFSRDPFVEGRWWQENKPETLGQSNPEDLSGECCTSDTHPHHPASVISLSGVTTASTIRSELVPGIPGAHEFEH